MCLQNWTWNLSNIVTDSQPQVSEPYRKMRVTIVSNKCNWEIGVLYTVYPFTELLPLQSILLARRDHCVWDWGCYMQSTRSQNYFPYIIFYSSGEITAYKIGDVIYSIPVYRIHLTRRVYLLWLIPFLTDSHISNDSINRSILPGDHLLFVLL